MAIIAFGNEPQAGMSTTTKYALGAAAAAAVGAVAWWMLKKKPAALKANKRKRARKCPICAATPKKTSTRCHQCGHNYGMRANPPYEVRSVRYGKPVFTSSKETNAFRVARRRAIKAGHAYSVFDRGVAGHLPGMGRRIATLRKNGKAKTKRAPGWQKKFYNGPATDWRTHAPPKYAKYGATQASHYAFPEAFKYPIHGHDVATTKRFIRTAAGRYAKFKNRIAPEYREAVGRRIEAAKKKYGIGEFNPKYARKTASKAAAKQRRVAGMTANTRYGYGQPAGELCVEVTLPGKKASKIGYWSGRSEEKIVAAARKKYGPDAKISVIKWVRVPGGIEIGRT